MNRRSTPSLSTITLLVAASQMWILLCGAYFLWEADSYRGIYAWLTEKQIARFGGYVPLFTYLFLFFLGSIPALILRWLARRLRQQHNGSINPVAIALRRAGHIRQLLFGAAGITGLFVIGTLTYALFLIPASAGPAQTITATDVEPADVAKGPARLVGGELGRVATFGQYWFIGERRVAYAPYRALALEGNATRLFVQLQSTNSEQPGEIVQRPSWSGYLVEGGMPGTMRALFAQLGAPAGDPYFTLYPDRRTFQSLYWVQAVQLALLTLFFLALGYLQSRRVRRLKEEAAQPS
jgi:hypothetical protein